MITRSKIATDIAAPIEKVFDWARDIGTDERPLAHTRESAPSLAGRSAGGGPDGSHAIATSLIGGAIVLVSGDTELVETAVGMYPQDRDTTGSVRARR